MKKTVALFIVNIFLFATVIAQQSNTITSFQTMYVQYDKSIYLPGETIWFKAYPYHVNEMSLAATNLYVGIYTEDGVLIQQKKYPILGGAAYGDFEIPGTIKSNRIVLKAFTKAMINNDSKNEYEKIIAIYQPEKNANYIAPNKNKTLQFFAEGGQMIAELENYVAFKAAYENGNPATIKGSIVEAGSNIIVDSFYTNKIGLGKIVLTPAAGKKYMARWKDDNGSIIQTPLPFNNNYGVSFHTQIQDGKLEYSMVKSKNNDSINTLHVLAQMGNYEVYKADLTIENENELAEASFAINDLPAGLLQVTLFDKYWEPLQQRLVFIRGHNHAPAVVLDTININKKRKNTFTITLQDTLFTNLSVAVTDVNFYNPAYSPAITNELLFGKQMPSLKQNMDSLIKLNDDKTIDLVMLTYPWNKYDWKKVVHKEDVKGEQVDDFISLVVNYENKNLKLAPNDSLNLVVNGKGASKRFYKLASIDRQWYKTPGLIFYDSVKLSYQLNINKEMVDKLTVKNNDDINVPVKIAALPRRVEYGLQQNNNIQLFANNTPSKFNDTTTIKGVVVKTKIPGNPILNRLEEIDKTYTSGMFSGTQRGYLLNVLDDPTAGGITDVANYIAYRVPNVQLREDPLFGYKYFVVQEYDIIHVKPPTKMPVFLNEQEVESVGELRLSDIAYIKYIPGIVIGAGFNSHVGAIYVYTKKGNESTNVASNLRSVTVKGYDKQQEFINPDYANSELVKQPDNRSTLYWNPSILLDKTNNTARVEFYNNDVSKKLLLTIEGINAAGELIHIEKIIE